jgi:hypothetical protein
MWEEMERGIGVAATSVHALMSRSSAHAAATGLTTIDTPPLLATSSGEGPSEEQVRDMARALKRLAADCERASAALEQAPLTTRQSRSAKLPLEEPLEALAGVAPLLTAPPSDRPRRVTVERLERLERELAATKAAASAAEHALVRKDAELVGLSFALRDSLLQLQDGRRMPGSASSASRFGLVEVVGRIPARAALAIWPMLDWGPLAAGGDGAGGGGDAISAQPHQHGCQGRGSLLVRHRGRLHLMKEAAMLHSDTSHALSPKHEPAATTMARGGGGAGGAGLAGAIAGAELLLPYATPRSPPHPHRHPLSPQGHSACPPGYPEGKGAAGGPSSAGWPSAAGASDWLPPSLLDTSPLADAHATLTALRMRPRQHYMAQLAPPPPGGRQDWNRGAATGPARTRAQPSPPSAAGAAAARPTRTGSGGAIAIPTGTAPSAIPTVTAPSLGAAGDGHEQGGDPVAGGVNACVAEALALPALSAPPLDAPSPGPSTPPPPMAPTAPPAAGAGFNRGTSHSCRGAGAGGGRAANAWSAHIRPQPGSSPRNLLGTFRRLAIRSVSEERAAVAEWPLSHSLRSLETRAILSQAEQLCSQYTPRYATREGQRAVRETRREPRRETAREEHSDGGTAAASKGRALSARQSSRLDEASAHPPAPNRQELPPRP